MEKDRIIEVGDEVGFELILRNGSKEQLIFTIVEDNYSDVEKGYLSNHSPIAVLLLGEKVGSIIPYFTDETIGIEILSLRNSTHPPSEITHQRRKRMGEIFNQIEFRDAVLFASSVNTKWGNYDPDALSHQNPSFEDKNPKEDGGD